MRSTKWFLTTAVLAVLCLLAAACGDDGGDAGTDDVAAPTTAPDSDSGDAPSEAESTEAESTEAESTEAAPDTASLTVWTQLGDNPALQGVLDGLNQAFMAQNPNISVEVEHQTFDNLQQTVPTALASGAGPDIIDFDANESTLGALAKTDLVIDLEPYFAQHGWDDQLFPWVRERVRFGAGPVGVGRSNEVVGIYYNADLFAELGLEPPETYGAFLAAADGLAEAGVTPIAFANLDQWPASHFLGVAVHASVPIEKIGGFESLAASGAWDDPAVAAAVAESVSWVDAGYVLDGFNGLGYDDGNAEFYAGRAGMHITGTWLVGDITANMADTDVRFIAFPMIDESLPKQAEGGIGGAWAITSSSDSPDAAALWIDFVHFSEEAEAAWVEAGVLPTTNFDMSTVDAPPLLKDNFAVLEAASAEGGIGYWLGFTAHPIVSDAFTSNSQIVLDGSLSVEDYISRMQDALVEARDNAS